MEAKEKVMEKLGEIKKEYPPAYYLRQAVEKFEFFTGEAYQTPTGRWKLFPYDEPAISVYYEGTPSYPRFGAYAKDGIWSCMLNHKKKTILLRFSTENGNLIEVRRME